MSRGGRWDPCEQRLCVVNGVSAVGGGVAAPGAAMGAAGSAAAATALRRAVSRFACLRICRPKPPSAASDTADAFASLAETFGSGECSIVLAAAGGAAASSGCRRASRGVGARFSSLRAALERALRTVRCAARAASASSSRRIRATRRPRRRGSSQSAGGPRGQTCRRARTAPCGAAGCPGRGSAAAREHRQRRPPPPARGICWRRRRRGSQGERRSVCGRGGSQRRWLDLEGPAGQALLYP